jgi:hypothetical protein
MKTRVHTGGETEMQKSKDTQQGKTSERGKRKMTTTKRVLRDYSEVTMAIETAKRSLARSQEAARKFDPDTVKEAARKIDAKTAEVTWWYAQTMDPYGIDDNLPEELQQIGRAYFARAPGSDVWVHFGDLSEAVRDALWEKHRASLAFVV